MAHEIPRDSIVNVYLNQMNNHATGGSNINPLIVLSVDDESHAGHQRRGDDTNDQRESLHPVLFLGFDSFTSEAPFHSSLFLEMRKQMGIEQINRNNVLISGCDTKWDELSVKSDSG